MANFNSWLIHRAQDVAEAAQQRIARLKQEIGKLKTKLAIAETALESANSAIDRLDSFLPIMGDDHQCPNCWVADGVRCPLKPIPSETGIDRFRCETCHREFSNE